MASRTLKDFAGQLIPFGFMRVHLSHLVNMARLHVYLHRDGGTLVLQDGQEVLPQQLEATHGFMGGTLPCRSWTSMIATTRATGR